MIRIINAANTYLPLIVCSLTAVGGGAVYWLSKSFVTKKEGEKIQAELVSVKKTVAEHSMLLSAVPTKDDFVELEIAIKNLECAIQAHNERYAAILDRIDNISMNINMLTEAHLRSEK